MILQALAFYMFAGLAILGALMVISARNPVHSVLFLILAFFSTAGLFVLLGAEFLAMILVVVYVGAVAVLFLFVVMMLDINFVELRQGFLHYLPMGILIGAVVLAEVLVALAGRHVGMEGGGTGAASPAAPTPDPATVDNTEALGALLYTHYIYLFQAAGMILLVAMIGAIVLTHQRRAGVRRQRIADQVARRPEDTLEVRKVPTGSGA